MRQRLADAARRVFAVVDDEDAPADPRRLGEDLGGVEADRLHGGRPQRQLVGDHLQADEALDPRHQRYVAHRLGEEIVGAAFETLHPVLGLVERRHHDDGNMRGAGVGLQRGADLEAGHVRHHHVEQHEIDALAKRDVERLAAAQRGADVEVFRLQPRLEQAHIGGDVIDDKDSRSHFAAPHASPTYDFTVCDEGRDGNRLGQIALAAALPDALFVALHGEGRDGDHRDVARRPRPA